MSLEQINSAIRPLRQALLEHPIYHDLRSSQALRVFMEHHVFAVWDFMSLLKALQQRLCCVSVPWLPPSDPVSARFINEIVLAEETDDDGHGGYASHFELYHQAMRKFDADTSMIDRFLQVLQEGQNVGQALRTADVPPPIQQFVGHTFQIIKSGDLCRIAATFTFGREDLLPDLFQKIVNELARPAEGRLDAFKFYLLRHVELDTSQHGPMANRLVATLCGNEANRWRTAQQAAIDALNARLVFWDAIHRAASTPSQLSGLEPCP